MRKLVLGFVVLLFLLATGGWFAWIQLGEPHYRSEAMIQLYTPPHMPPDLQTPHVANLVALEGQSIGAMMREIRNQAVLIRSDEVLQETIQWPSIKSSDWFARFDGDVRAAATDLARRVDAHPVPDATLLRVSVEARDSVDAQRLLDALLTVYIQKREVQAENLVAQQSAVLIRERERAIEETRRGQLERDRFLQENDVASLDPTGPALPWIAQQLVAAELQLELLETAPDDPDTTSAIEQTKKTIAYWQNAQATTHMQARDHMQKLLMLRPIEKAIERDQRRSDTIGERLLALRLTGTVPGFARATRAAAPTEAERVWWRWPWD
ncbi:MAG: hypothetical protein AAF328_03340 [Planctomycetota bacterium]